MNLKDDLYLLQHSPEILIEKHAKIIQKWLTEYVNNGFLEIKNPLEVQQKITAILLQELQNHTGTLQTTVYGFLVRKIRSICNQLCNKQDLQLLYSDQPNRIITKYQKLIFKETMIYQSRGSFKQLETSEVVQELNEVLLRRILPKLVQFEGKSLFRTYFKTVLRNLLHETYKRLTKVHEKQQSAVDYDDISNLDSSNELNWHAHQTAEDMVSTEEAIELQKNIFEVCLRKHPIEARLDFVLCLKVNQWLVLISKDVFEYWQNCPDNVVVEILSYFGIDYQHFTKGNLFEHLAEIITWKHTKELKPDTLRKRYASAEKQLLVAIFQHIGLQQARQFSLEDFVHGYYRGA
ncbi:MAG: hypothetical protein R3E32_08415 [Chitinophagales bacterium]